MSRRGRANARSERKPPGDDVVTVTVCRGCCCGSTTKHPGIDHTAQVEQLRHLPKEAGRGRLSDCLDACERSNVVVVSPSAAGRRAGARSVWLGGVLDDEATADVVAWVNAGGPGVADSPGVLDLSEFHPSNRTRKTFET